MAKQDLVKENKEKFLTELASFRSAGNVLVACTALGFARRTVYNWRADDEQFASDWDEAVRDGYEQRAEEAENALRTSITKDHNITAIIFALKNLKSDKYREKVDVEHSGRIANDNLKPGFLATLVRLGKQANEQTTKNPITKRS
jgi:hypothetical protein